MLKKHPRQGVGGSSAPAMGKPSFVAHFFPFIIGREGSCLYPLTNLGGEIGYGRAELFSNNNDEVLEADKEDFRKLNGEKKFALHELLAKENIHSARLSPTNFLSKLFLSIFLSF